MKKPRKRTSRGHRYSAMAQGAKIMGSPLAGSFEAAAEHYEQSDSSIESAATSNDQAGAPKEKEDRK